MSKKNLMCTGYALETANKVVDHLILEGLSHLDIEITCSEVRVSAFIHNYEQLDDVRSIMKIGNYPYFEYKENEMGEGSDRFMLCESHYKYQVI